MTYFDPLCRFVRSYVGSWEAAQDLVGDVFLQVWLRRDSLETHRNLEAYLFTTARNHAVSHLRHRRVEARHRSQSVSEHQAIPPPTNVPMPDEELMVRELTASLQRAVDALPPRQREVVLLKWERQAGREEIARTLGMAPKTVAEHFRRALERLRTALSGELKPETAAHD